MLGNAVSRGNKRQRRVPPMMGAQRGLQPPMQPMMGMMQPSGQPMMEQMIQQMVQQQMQAAMEQMMQQQVNLQQQQEDEDEDEKECDDEQQAVIPANAAVPLPPPAIAAPAPLSSAAASSAAASFLAPPPEVAPKHPPHSGLPPFRVEGSDMIYNMGNSAAPTRSTSLLKGICRRRLTLALREMIPSLDAGYLSELTQKGLLQMLWLLTRLKPSVRISHLSFLVVNLFAIIFPALGCHWVNGNLCYICLYFYCSYFVLIQLRCQFV